MRKVGSGLRTSSMAELDEVRRITAQVIHDIRSPLSALSIISRDLADIDSEKQDLLKSIIGRIQGIARNLNRVSQRAGLESSVELPKCYVRESLEKVVREKQIELKLHPAIHLSYECHQFDGDLMCVAEAIEFSSMISNLINNSVEACEGAGEIKVILSKTHGGVQIEIRDNGKGISLDKLSLVGERGVSFGKFGGSGLGIYHAKRCLEEWGGSFRIFSAPLRGTVVWIALRHVST